MSKSLKCLSIQELSDLKLDIDAEINARLHETSANGALTEEESACLRKSDLIGCVKLIRDRTGLGIRDAKNYMDRARGLGVLQTKQAT